MTTIQVRRDTAANWAAKNPTPKAGEPCFETDTLKFKVGDGVTTYNNLPYYVNSVENLFTLLNDKLYDGVDLSVKFANEIKGFANVWAWIKDRIQKNNYSGIHVGDKIPFALAGGTISDGTTSYNITAKTLYAQIAGIDTYYGYGDSTVGHHIDFISTACIGTNIPWNPQNNNNGTANQANPWLASKLYACLNGVNNYTTSAFNSVAHGYDASSGGVLQMLPTELQNVIIEKRLYAPTRYSASGILTDTPSAAWLNQGKLWLPTEIEVQGSAICSGGSHDQYGVDRNICGAPVQYPLFVGSNSYRNNKNKNRVNWWLSSVPSGSSAQACIVNNSGIANAHDCANAHITAPVCFRIG